MTRRLLNVVTVLSFVLCVAVAALCVVSFWREEGQRKFDGRRQIARSARRRPSR
jgi:hypothetical protein